MIRALSLSVAIVVPILSTLSVRNVQARQMNDCDMASLWYLSEVVVEGEELGYTEENYWLVGKVRVTRVHKANDKVAVGDEIPVAHSALSRKMSFAGAEIDTKQVLLFLTWNQEGNIYRPAEHYLPVPSGVRLIVDADDVVYRFEQQNNPGPYAPVRQGPELIDRSELEKRKVRQEDQAFQETWPEYWESLAYVYGRAALRRDLDLAKRRVERLRAALDSHDVDALESFLPSTLPMAKIWSTVDGRHSVRGNYTDALASAAATEFVKHADNARIASVLEKHRRHLTFQVLQTLER